MFTMPLPGILITWVRPDVLRYYNLAFALPSIIYGLLIFRIWSAGSHSLATQQMAVLQGYAYLFGVKDRLFGTTHEWVSSGENVKAHKKNNVFATARATAIVWTCLYQGAFISGAVHRVLGATVLWYEILPQILLYGFNLYCAIPFLLSK